ncbi:glycoside hydrolase family 3 protein [Fulvivirga sp. M361]|uniref:glycoside hydrolase family 3 protein n=1 Tax=Fulvivirga sp. M361 TaxID=2594266 RepID=UPI00117AD36B|nr:glycoside hydrolase family 3 protein [Fulvivirga sp. M361]TRX50928.1 glycoside hydrolase family 3 protein [Fulvivirga sp. M361]
MEQLTTSEKVGQLFFPAVYINDSDANIRKTEQLIQQYHVGGLTFFHSPEMAATNYEKKHDIPKNERSHERLMELIQHYQSVAKHPLVMSIDAEWGLAMRVENTEQYPYALSLGASSDPYLVFEVGEAIAKDLKATGIHLNLAPVMDLNVNPANPVIGYRSFGQHREKVTELALAFYRGMKSVGILGCAKHFPGHGDTSVDSHLGLPTIDKSEAALYEQELYPFQKAIEIGIDCIMPGHLSVPALSGSGKPASLSHEIVTGLLRKKLGHKGAVFTDALNMHAVSNLYQTPGDLEWAAFSAGNDILSFSKNIPAGIEKILNQASEEQIEGHYQKVNELKQKAGLVNGGPEGSAVPLTPMESSHLKQKVAASAITVVKKGPGMPFPAESPEKIGLLSLNKSAENNAFFKTLVSFKAIPAYELVSYSEPKAALLKESLTQYDHVIVALYVPHIKPAGKFGLAPEMLQWLTGLMTVKKVALVVFGNPYSLAHILYERADHVILAYQDMYEFEQKAAQLLFGAAQGEGSLPVDIKKILA